jgi:hypothetical protein
MRAVGWLLVTAARPGRHRRTLHLLLDLPVGLATRTVDVALFAFSWVRRNARVVDVSTPGPGVTGSRCRPYGCSRAGPGERARP